MISENFVVFDMICGFHVALLYPMQMRAFSTFLQTHFLVLETCNSLLLSTLSFLLHPVALCLCLSCHLCAAGSHDAFTHALDKTSELGPDTSQTIKDLAKMFGPMAKEIIFRWSLTQNLSLTGQLRAGIRYFDLRVASREGQDDVFFIHALFGKKVKSGLEEVASWLEHHPGEVVILDFNHLYHMTPAHHEQLLGDISSIFGKRLCPRQPVSALTLASLEGKGHQVIVFYHDKCASDRADVWPATLIKAPWPDTTDVQRMVGFLETEYQRGRPEDMFHVHQGVLTPDAGFIIAHFSGSLGNLAFKVNPVFADWIANKSGHNKVNICQADFVEKGNFIHSVLSLNK